MKRRVIPVEDVNTIIDILRQLRDGFAEGPATTAAFDTVIIVVERAFDYIETLSAYNVKLRQLVDVMAQEAKVAGR